MKDSSANRLLVVPAVELADVETQWPSPILGYGAVQAALFGLFEPNGRHLERQ
jgi:hypothetical protein